MIQPLAPAGAPAVDLSNCDREPIHIPGLIQSFGFLLALTSDWMVARASANSEAFIGQPAAALIGRPVLDILGGEAVHAIRNRVALLRGPDATERLFALPVQGVEQRFDCAVHLANGGIVVELEPCHPELGDGAGLVRSMMARLDQAETLDGFLREGARQIRALTGFDRVMVYRFHANGDGEVVAEAARSGIGSFLGLNYPHTDIPAQARRLYERNLFRIIADVAAPPVPIVPALDESGRPLDLSLAVLRAVSPIHIEYLTNMGVGASLSVSILLEGKLWGLFACHHYGPRCPGLERRSLTELFGQMFAMKLETIERRAAAAFADRARAVGDRLLVQLAGNESLRDDPAWLAETIGDAIPSDGIGVIVNGQIALAGLTPREDAFVRLVRELNRTTAGRVFATDSIAGFFPEAAEWGHQAVGMLALPISRSPRDYVVLFRQEMVRSVRWAGDPHTPKSFGPNGDRLSPRKSFEAWSETVQGRSLAFSPAELDVAEKLRGTLIEVVLRMSDEAHAERQLAAERQELLIAELNHRVRNILALIRGLVRQSRGSTGSVEEFVRELDARIHALARAHNQITADHWNPAPVRGLIETEAEAYLGGASGRVQATGPDVLLSPNAFSTLALVIHELVTNSAKYGSLSDSGRVETHWAIREDGALILDWREIGGPAVTAPRRQGFGSTIIRRSIPYDLGGEAEVEFALTGLRAHFVIPAAHVGRRPGAAAREASAPAVRPAEPRTRPSLPAGPVLLVEDSLIIAMDAEDILVRLGAERVLTANSVRAGLEEIALETPVLAILDVNLGPETSLPIADRLKALGVPYLFATGYGEQAQLPEPHAQIPVVQKPYTQDGVEQALRAVLPTP
ncbi:HWE histidine kinase domain-containing protein [Sphingomonas morindae]|uniref:histidine kinase n=1 Tax=Sphingomonas morindae TaxID=1541170 RepID=A0ABY4XAW2_9SPHN|nr:HWE histidine kinase domain-containing protein [Sphingomonas morindae]USI73835.1 GAF domain-containing protein [Sphingomonas morindae]